MTCVNSYLLLCKLQALISIPITLKYQLLFKRIRVLLYLGLMPYGIHGHRIVTIYNIIIDTVSCFYKSRTEAVNWFLISVIIQIEKC